MYGRQLRGKDRLRSCAQCGRVQRRQRVHRGRQVQRRQMLRGASPTVQRRQPVHQRQLRPGGWLQFRSQYSALQRWQSVHSARWLRGRQLRARQIQIVHRRQPVHRRFLRSGDRLCSNAQRRSVQRRRFVYTSRQLRERRVRGQRCTALRRRQPLHNRPALQREIGEANDDRGLPKFLTKAVEAFLDCGMLPKGFMSVRCKTCKTDQFVAFSCKSRGICSSCDGKRMTELAAHLCDSVIAAVPVRQFVLTVPGNLRYVLTWNAKLRAKVLGAFMRALEKHYVRLALAQGAVEPQFAAISVLQRWDDALRALPHWHVLAADGVWQRTDKGMKFLAAEPLRDDQLEALLADAIKRITLHR